MDHRKMPEAVSVVAELSRVCEADQVALESGLVDGAKEQTARLPLGIVEPDAVSW